jgi:hypothetical protein
MIPALLSVFLLVSDTPATTTDAAVTATQAAPATAPKVKEKKICKTDPEYTGSRMKKNICLTAADWAKRNGSGVSNDRAGRTYSAQ